MSKKDITVVSKKNMHCTNCRHNNPSDAIFCNQCGIKIAKKCPKCGQENRGLAKFCDNCGNSITETTSAKEVYGGPIVYGGPDMLK